MPDRRIVILGKLPPPYMGPAVATKIILQSKLKESFELIHVDTKAYQSLSELGKWSARKLFKNIGIYFRLFKTCLSGHPDLVLVPISQANMGFLKDSIFILIAKLTFRKVLIQLRGSNFKNWYASCNFFFRSYIRFVLKRTEGVIVLGNNLRHVFGDFFPPEKIYVCPNGINYKVEKTNHQSVNVLYLANLNPAKGIEDVLAAIKIMGEKGMKDFNVHVVGEWLSDELKKKCTDYKENFNLPVTFHPPATENSKPSFFGDADIFIFTPREPEGHPWVIIEAMAAGLPVISTDQGAIIESVHDQENGFIVPAENPEAIADRLTILIRDEVLRKKMGDESRRLYQEQFTEDKMTERLKKIFDQVIAD